MTEIMTVKAPGRVHVDARHGSSRSRSRVSFSVSTRRTRARDARPGQYRDGDTAVRRSVLPPRSASTKRRKTRKHRLFRHRQAHARTRRVCARAIGSTMLRSARQRFRPLRRARASVAIVAGGVGIASVLLAAQWLLRAGSRGAAILRRSHRQDAGRREAFRATRLRVAVSTDDGSAGHHGFVTDSCSSGRRQLPNCCSRAARRRCCVRSRASPRTLGVRAQLSLEETFACGVGGCWGCVVPLVGESAQAPSFPRSRSAAAATSCTRASARRVRYFGRDELRW